MSTSYRIIEFSKPKKRELCNVDYFSEYSRYGIDGADGSEDMGFIRLFALDNARTSNIISLRFAVPMEVPEIVTDYEKLYYALGFNEDAIRNRKVHLRSIWENYEVYTDGIDCKEIHINDLRKYEYTVYVKCVAIKMEELWDSGETFVYLDGDRIKRYIPDIDKYDYVPVNNNILAKAEIPFLIFERYKGRCFLEKY